jgi:ectoine hydroxylase-related dioxygenase (phytanoyl-CoA dioxygenase family)
MLKLLSDQAVSRYREDGFVFPLQAYSTEAAGDLRRNLEAFEAAQGGRLEGGMKQKLHLLLTWVADIVHHPTIVDAVEDVLGPDILCWQTSFFTKEPRDPGYVSWHQDGNYWGLSCDEVMTAWLALSAATPESGCMRMLPGSHRWDRVPHLDTFDENNLLTRGQVMQAEVDERAAVDVVLQPGEFSLHHVDIAHASSPNRSDDRRIGLAIRYITPRVEQTTGVPDSAMLVRGEDHHGHFELEPRPETDMAPAALALHKRVTETRREYIYRTTEIPGRS